MPCLWTSVEWNVRAQKIPLVTPCSMRKHLFEAALRKLGQWSMDVYIICFEMCRHSHNMITGDIDKIRPLFKKISEWGNSIRKVCPRRSESTNNAKLFMISHCAPSLGYILHVSYYFWDILYMHNGSFHLRPFISINLTFWKIFIRLRFIAIYYLQMKRSNKRRLLACFNFCFSHWYEWINRHY